MAKETAAQQSKIHTVMHEFKVGTLHDGPDKYGHHAQSRQQAIAIAMHEAGVARSKNPHMREAATGKHQHGNPHK